MTRQVAVLLEARVAVAREHLAVGVDVDPRALGLPEQLRQILQVVSRDKDGLPFLCAERYGGGHGVPEGARVGRIEQLHRAQVHLAALENEPQGRLEGDLAVGQRGQRLVDEGEDGRVLLAEDLGVVRVGRDALGAEEQGVLEREDVGACRRVGLQPHAFALGDEPLEGAGGLEGKRIGGRAEASAGSLHLADEAVAGFHGLPDESHEALRVEVHVGQRREERLDREDVGLTIDDAHSPCLGCRGREPDKCVDQEVLQGGDVVRLAADAPLRAGLALRRLLALVTEHGQPPPLG